MTEKLQRIIVSIYSSDNNLLLGDLSRRLDGLEWWITDRQSIELGEKYTFNAVFETNRPLTQKEFDDIENTLRLQLDEPWVEQGDGQWDDAEFDLSVITCEMKQEG